MITLLTLVWSEFDEPLWDNRDYSSPAIDKEIFEELLLSSIFLCWG